MVSGISSSFNSGTSTLSRFTSKVTFQRFNFTLMAWTVSSDISRLWVPCQRVQAFLLAASYPPSCPAPYRILIQSRISPQTQILYPSPSPRWHPLLHVFFLFPSPLLYFEGSSASLYRYKQFIEIFFKSQALIQKRIHINCSISEAWGLASDSIQFALSAKTSSYGHRLSVVTKDWNLSSSLISLSWYQWILNPPVLQTLSFFNFFISSRENASSFTHPPTVSSKLKSGWFYITHHLFYHYQRISNIVLLPCFFQSKVRVFLNTVSKVVKHMFGVIPPKCFDYTLTQGLKKARAFLREKHNQH